MPRRRGPRQRRKRQSRPRMSRMAQYQVYPVSIKLKAGNVSEVTIATIQETFDRSRSFRIASFSYQFCAINKPISIYFKCFGPVSTSDNLWTSGLVMIPTGTVRTGRHRIPVTNCGWYPSGAVTTAVLFEVSTVCIEKSSDSIVYGTVEFVIQVRPYEPGHSCPAVATERECGYVDGSVSGPSMLTAISDLQQLEMN